MQQAEEKQLQNRNCAAALQQHRVTMGERLMRAQGGKNH
jgi:hypothetical protein